MVTKMAKTVTDILLLSPTHLVSNTRHQQRCNLSWLWLYGFRVVKTPLFYLQHSIFESYFGCQLFYITAIFLFYKYSRKRKKRNLKDGIDAWQWVTCFNGESCLHVTCAIATHCYQAHFTNEMLMQCYFTYGMSHTLYTVSHDVNIAWMWCNGKHDIKLFYCESNGKVNSVGENAVALWTNVINSENTER